MRGNILQTHFRVSIHAPVKERHLTLVIIMTLTSFNSRSREGATLYPNLFTEIFGFNSRSREGATQVTAII